MKRHNNKSRFYPILLSFLILTAILGQQAYDRIKNNLVKSADLVTVRITEKGFIPKEVSVDFGEKISFVNEDKNPHWVASNNHPTHELYPEFDPRGPLNPGETWSFTIKKSGGIPYHDHLSPQNRGLIIVRGNGGAKISKPNNQKNITLEEANQIIKAKGATEAWLYLKANFENTRYGIHDIAHYIGGKIYDEKGVTAIKNCDSSFGFGCYHGFLEELIDVEGIKNLHRVLEECRKLPRYSGQATCYHGLGHALLPYEKYNLATSLESCNKLFENDMEKNWCHEGIFMENSSYQSKNARIDDPLWPCSGVDDTYKSACYKYHIPFLLRLFSTKNLGEAFMSCKIAEKKEYVNACVSGLGYHLSQANSGNLSEFVRLCSLAGKDLEFVCQTAGAEGLVFYRKPYDEVKNVICDPMPSQWREDCIKRINVQLAIQD